MPLERIFTDFTNDFEGMMISGMDEIIQAGLADMRGQFFTAMCLYVIGIGFLTMWQKMDFGEFAWAGIRAVVVSSLLQSMNYTYYIRNLFFTDLPNRWAAAMGGPSISTGSATQFDALWSAVVHCIATISAAAPGMLGIFDRLLANLAGLMILMAMIVMFLVWLMSRVFMAVVICMGPFVLLSFLFRSTRFIGDAWIGKLVGLAALQLTSAILLRFVLRTVSGRLYALQNQMGGSLDMMHQTMLQIVGVFWMGAMLMLILPSVVAIGSGIGAGSAVASMQLAGAATRVARMPLRVLSR